MHVLRQLLKEMNKKVNKNAVHFSCQYSCCSLCSTECALSACKLIDNAAAVSADGDDDDGICVQNPNWGVKREPLQSPLTTVHSDELSDKALSLFKLVSHIYLPLIFHWYICTGPFTFHFVCAQVCFFPLSFFVWMCPKSKQN